MGEVKISVDNRSLAAPSRRGPAPTKHAPPKRPGAEAPIANQGKYVPIPEKYSDPETSGLTYKVEKGAGPHEIRLE
jgi:hypothetical protein